MENKKYMPSKEVLEQQEKTRIAQEKIRISNIAEDKAWETLSEKEKGVLYQYGLFLRTYVNFTVCHTVSAHWTKMSNWSNNEAKESFNIRTTKYRKDNLFYQQLVSDKEQQKMIDGVLWDDKRLSEKETIELIKEYDKFRLEAMEKARKYMDLHFPNEK
jgi:hypothetical protein